MLTAVVAQSREVTIGDLRFQVPDSMGSEKYEGLDYLAFSPDLTLMVKDMSLANKDEAKVKKKGELRMFPKLAEATLISEEEEPWHDWTIDYIRRTYTMSSDEATDTIISYQVTANGRRYFFLMLPYTPKGLAMAREMATPDNIDNGKLFGNAGWWWVFYIVLFLLVFFLGITVGEEYTVAFHATMGFICLTVFGIFALLMCHFDWAAFLKSFWWILGIVVIVPLPFLRKPIALILENIDG